MKLLIASRNKHKIEEIRAVFSLPAVEMIAASRLPDLPDVEEDAATSEGNAVKKAVTQALAGRNVNADARRFEDVRRREARREDSSGHDLDSEQI